MFTNLAAEIARKGITNKSFAESVGINPVTFSKKINGNTEFLWSEVKRIWEFFKGAYTMEYLFEENEEV